MSKLQPPTSVTLNPTQLFFPAEDPAGWENVLRLRNLEKGRAPSQPSPGQPAVTNKQGFFIFKVRSTAPDHYHVRPRIGLINPDSTRVIRIAAKSMPQDVLRDIRAGRGRHTFAIEVRRVTNERALNQALSCLLDGSSDRKTSDALKELFELSNEPLTTWTLNTNFHNGRLQWVPAETVGVDGCTGVVIERNEAGVVVAEHPASLSAPSTATSDSASKKDAQDASITESPGVDPNLDRALRKLDEQIEDRRAEESRLRAELLALRNQAQQLQADCDAVLRISTANQRKLEDLRKATEPARPAGAAQLVSLPVPIMVLLVLSTFIIALAFRPASHPHRTASGEL